MRYLLQESFANELCARKEYLYDTLKLWTIITDRKAGFIQLASVPTNAIEVFFIVGHNSAVKEYIKKTPIAETIVVAITCDGTIHFSKLKIPGKILYIPHQNQNKYADLFKGELYNFKFDLTESEILFYNLKNNANLIEWLDKAFTRV